MSIIATLHISTSFQIQEPVIDQSGPWTLGNKGLPGPGPDQKLQLASNSRAIRPCPEMSEIVNFVRFCQFRHFLEIWQICQISRPGNLLVDKSPGRE